MTPEEKAVVQASIAYLKNSDARPLWREAVETLVSAGAEPIPNARRRLADYLSEYAHGVVEEWMRIVEIDESVEEPGSTQFQARATWMGDGSFLLGAQPHSADYGQYRLTVKVEPLPDELIGPENDPAQRYEIEPVTVLEPVEPAPEWVPTEWLLVLPGDHVRLNGQEADVATLRVGDWHADIKSRLMESGRWWDSITAWDHKELYVRLAHLDAELPFPPSSPVEILMDRTRQAQYLLQTAFPGSRAA